MVESFFFYRSYGARLGYAFPFFLPMYRPLRGLALIYLHHKITLSESQKDGKTVIPRIKVAGTESRRDDRTLHNYVLKKTDKKNQDQYRYFSPLFRLIPINLKNWKNMANTYTQLTIHAVFAVKGRQSFISDDFKESLFHYMGGTLKGLNQYPLLINGHKDHVHILFELNPKNTISEIIQKVKANSSRWINEQAFIHGRFSWQSGYGAFSNSRSQRKRLIRYIENQEYHHSIKSFKEEYVELLKEYSIGFNEKYLFEFYYA